MSHNINEYHVCLGYSHALQRGPKTQAAITEIKTFSGEEYASYLRGVKSGLAEIVSNQDTAPIIQRL